MRRNIATQGELYEAAEWEARRRGVKRKLNSDLFQDLELVYRFAVRHTRGAQPTFTIARAATDIGCSERTVRSCLRKLERMGLLRTDQVTTPTGKTLCLRVELVAVNEVAALSRGCSSAG